MSELKTTFDESRKLPSGETLEQLRQNYYIQAQMRGSDEQSIGGLNVNTSGRQNSAFSKEKKRNEKANDAMFYALLNDMRERLADLEASMAQRYKTLQLTYGDDVVGGMVDTYLSDEEKAGLETDSDKMHALADKFLNEDGAIKDEYKNTEEAKYLRDWQEEQKLRPIVQKYEGRNDLTNDEKREIHSTAQSVGLAGQDNMYLESNNAGVKDEVEQVMNEGRTEKEVLTQSTAFSFAKPI